MQIYGETQSEYGQEAFIPFTYPEDRDGAIVSLVFWGDVAGEFDLFINNQLIVGGRTSPQVRTLQLDFSQTPIMLNTADELSVRVAHYNQGLRSLKMTLFVKGV